MTDSSVILQKDLLIVMEKNNETMTRTDILGLLTELLVEDVSLEQLNGADVALKAYSDILSAGDKNEEELDDILPDIVEQLQDKRRSLIEEKERVIRSENLKQKEAVIEQLRSLIQDEENIGKAFTSFNHLRDDWNAIGDIPRDQYGRVQTEFSRLQESFYYTINIYKELADHDKRINLRKKKDLVVKVNELSEEKNPQAADSRLRVLIKQWDDVGATFPGDWEAVKEEFWKGARDVMARVDGYYEGVRAKQTENFEKKKLLIKQVADISAKEREKRKEWDDSTEKVLAIQKDWKKIGFSKDNESIWKEFRGACDIFFQAKNAYFDKLGEAFNDRKVKKETLIAKAAELATSEDWRDTAKAIQDLQKEWKEIGPASQRDENRLWKQFRSHCDSFFNARNRTFKEREKEEKENQGLKEDIISRLETLELSGNKGMDIQRLRDFSEQWKNVGYVPFKAKDKLYKDFKAQLDKHYGALKLDEKEKRQVSIQNKVASIKNDPSSANREKSHIRRQIDGLINDNRQYENNLGFFNDPSGNSPLVKEVERKIKRNHDRIKELKETLRLLSSVEA